MHATVRFCLYKGTDRLAHLTRAWGVQRLLTAHGHYLDASPRPLADSPDAATFTTARLDGLQAETKYAHDAIMTRLKQSSLIRYAASPGCTRLLALLGQCLHQDGGCGQVEEIPHSPASEGSQSPCLLCGAQGLPAGHSGA